MYGFAAFSIRKKVNCVTWYSANKSITQTRRIYRQTDQKIPPSRNSILRWIQKFQDHGSVEIQHQSGRPSMSFEDEWRIPNYFNRHPRAYLQTAENRLRLPGSSIQSVLRHRLHLFPCILHIVQDLEERDNEALIEFAHWCLENIELKASFLNRVIFSD